MKSFYKNSDNNSNVEPVIGAETNVLNDLTVTPSILPNQIIGL